MDFVEGRLAPPPRRRRGQLRLVTGVGLAGILATAYLMATFLPQGSDPAGTGSAQQASDAAEVRAQAAPPPVEPLKFIDISPDDARSVNARMPFITGPIAVARPFIFDGTPQDRARAVACLAAAVLYEAGDDPIGERAVAQVVLNRMRHPAFPKTVCGVVFQGSQLRTGCQFTFTCDGALARRRPEEMWVRARAIAGAAIDGSVMTMVGNATHYHTDWVVPYWASSLDKLTEVHTHLFYRWRGVWGRPAAFAGRYAGSEPIDPRIAFLVDAEALAGEALVPPPSMEATLGAPGGSAIAGVAAAELKGASPRLVDNATSTYALLLDPAAFPGSYATTALGICAGKPDCTVIGYLRADRMPGSLPVSSEELRRASFYYRVRKAAGIETVAWNCREIPRPDPAQCLPGSAPDEAGAAAK